MLTSRGSRTLLALLLCLGALATPIALSSPAQALIGPSAASLVRGVVGHGAVSVVPPAGGTAPAPCAGAEDNPGGTASAPNAGTEVDCPTEDPASFDHCTTTGDTTDCTVTLTASVSDSGGWRFDHWSGDCAGSNSQCVLISSDTFCDSTLKPPCTTTYQDLRAVAHFVDTRAPTASFTQAPANNGVVYSDVPSQTFRFTSDEVGETSGDECSIEGLSYSGCGTNVTRSALEDGLHDFCIRATDYSGLVGPTTCRHWEQERNPTVTITTKPADTTTTTEAAAFTYSSNKTGHRADGSTLSYRCRVDGASFATCPATGVSYADLTNGSHTFEVEAVFHGVLEAAGQARTALASYTWTQADSTPPTFTLDGPSGIVLDQSHTFSYTGVAADQDTFRCSYDGADLTTCADGSTTITSTALGVHSFVVQATDRLGQVTTKTLRWDQEQVPNVVVDSGPAPGASVGGESIWYRFHSANPSAWFRCRLDTGPITVCSGPGGQDHLSGMTNGRHTLTFYPIYTSPLGGTLEGAPVARSWTTVLAPHCTLRLASTKVRHRRATLAARCDNAVTATLGGTLRIKVPHRHRRYIRIAAVATRLAANRTTTLSIRLPASAVRALRHHWRVRGSFTLHAHDLGGYGVATTAYARLR